MQANKCFANMCLNNKNTKKYKKIIDIVYRVCYYIAINKREQINKNPEGHEQGSGPPIKRWDAETG